MSQDQQNLTRRAVIAKLGVGAATGAALIAALQGLAVAAPQTVQETLTADERALVEHYRTALQARPTMAEVILHTAAAFSAVAQGWAEDGGATFSDPYALEGAVLGKVEDMLVARLS